MKEPQAWRSHYTYSFLLLYTLLVLVAVRGCFFLVNSTELAGNIPIAEYAWMIWYGLRSDMVVAILIVLPVNLAWLLFRKKNAGFYRQVLLVYYVLMILLVVTVSLVDIIYFNSNHRRLALADLFLCLITQAWRCHL